MTSENKVWETLKAEYLKKVEKALSSVKHPHIAEVLEDVQSHLEQRFAALEPDKQTRKNLEGIISEMGPACDYAELLSPEAGQPHRSNRKRYLLWFSLTFVIIVAIAILLQIAISQKHKEHKHLTISKAYWFHSDQRPSSIPADAVPQDDDGHMLFHVNEWFEELGTADQYRPFLNQADNQFLLKADGHPDVNAYAERGCWSKEFYVRIPKREYIKMAEGIPYTVLPVNSNPKYQWKVALGVTICKSSKLQIHKQTHFKILQ